MKYQYYKISILSTILTSHLTTSTNALTALLTGATGRTGQMVTKSLLQKGFSLKIFCRDETKARTIFNNDDFPNIIFCQGDIGNPNDIQAAFQDSNEVISHVIFMAGGEGADYKCVNYKGVAEFAKCAAASNVKNFVLISSAWATRPYSIASLLFNSLYYNTIPMASHYLGEQALRKAAKSGMNYVILRAGGLNSDERYDTKYPEAAGMGLTYSQGDTFEFLGIAGRPGMKRSQLAGAVVSAVDVEGQYTVEVTGSGTVTDSTVYKDLVQDDIDTLSVVDQEDEIFKIHTDAVMLLRNTAIAASLSAITLIVFHGWLMGLVLISFMDALIVFLWSRFFANRQAC